MRPFEVTVELSMSIKEGELKQTVTRWRNAANAIEAHRPAMTSAEDSGDPRKIAEESHVAGRLFDELSAARDACYTLQLLTLEDATELLRLMREAEQDVFEDPLLRQATDNVIAALHNFQERAAPPSG